MERPMPTPPPVTMAILLSRENGDVMGRLYPAGGRSALEGDGPAGCGMDEAEAARVEAEAPERILLPTVLAVAHDRVPELGELHADLMPPPRAERELEEGSVPPPPEHAVVRDRLLARACRPHAQALSWVSRLSSVPVSLLTSPSTTAT
jgi:hypothetical protein